MSEKLVTCSFCGALKNGDVPFFTGQNAHICGRCVDRFIRRVVSLESYRHNQNEVEAVFPCPSCGEPVMPTLCPHCNFRWNPGDMALNLNRIVMVSRLTQWAHNRFPDKKYYLAMDFDLRQQGSSTVFLTLPLHHRSDNLEEEIKGAVDIQEGRGDSIEIRYDDLFFAR